MGRPRLPTPSSSWNVTPTGTATFGQVVQIPVGQPELDSKPKTKRAPTRDTPFKPHGVKSKILIALREGPKNYLDLAEELRTTRATVANALTELRRKRYVTRGRHNRWMLPGWEPPRRRRG